MCGRGWWRRCARGWRAASRWPRWWRRSRRSTPSCWRGASCGNRCPPPRRWSCWPTRRGPRRCRCWRTWRSVCSKVVAVVNGVAKIVGGHRDRLAVVYLRQSSMAQVREHTQSTMRQYGLVEEAVRLGWGRRDVLGIDTDPGVSGRWGVARAGFAELVSRVCTGQVGAIFGIEISRLARSNAEVARLMEFAAITETLLIDADGVYDPGDVNDRMLLGMKSTIGEVELHVMAQRLQASKKAAAARGELRTPLPVGYVHDEAGEIVIDPDAEVQAAIGDLFAAFTACGSAFRGGGAVAA